MKNSDFSTKVAATFLAFLFLGNDLMASTRALISMPEPAYPTHSIETAQGEEAEGKKEEGASGKMTSRTQIATPGGHFKVWAAEEGETVKGKVLSLSIRDLPEIPVEIKNLSKGGGGYRFVSSSEDTVRVSIALDPTYDLAKLSRTQIYYFDKETKQWIATIPDKIDLASYGVEGMVPANTDYFAGLVTVPEMPEASAYVPTAMSDIQAASPAAGMNIMQPPSASRTGEAFITYPLDIPVGRQGMQPGLALTYNSDRGTGWMGVGWDLEVPVITIDTRWGAPTFDPDKQEEVYLLNGSPLIEQGGKKGNRNPGARQTPGPVRFLESSTQSYKKIERFGSSTQDYRWVVTTADNTKYYYGTIDGTAVDGNAVLKSGNHIAKWYLKKVMDKWGNYIIYNYTTGTASSATGIAKDGKYVVLSSITYTGFGTDLGKYSIVFLTTTGRKDATVNMKLGVKELDYHKLNKISVRYNGVAFKNYQFTYQEGDFGKTRLTRIQENRSGSEFIAHVLKYYDEGLTYGPAQTVTVDNLFDNVFNEMPEVVQRMAAPVSSHIVRSPLSTSVSYGWGAGGSIGLGIEPGFLPVNSKGFTFSGRLGYNETYNRQKMFLDDVNGDGLPDLVLDKGKKYYYPIQKDQLGNLSLGPYKDIDYSDRLYKSRNSTWQWGVDFTSPFNTYYYGLNWTSTSTENHTYLTDYNADGLKDLVTGNTVQFGQLSLAGDYSFTTSSQNTPNPVLRGEPAMTPDEDEPLKDLEIVRVWEAPFTGTVNITGTATLTAPSADGVSAGIQHNNTVKKAMTAVSPAGTNMAVSGLSVQKGDKLLMRAYAKDNGYSDFIHWNPQVSYTGLTRIDANGINYTSSTYQDGFLLSAPEGVTLRGDQQLKVIFPAPGSGTFTDDVTFRIRVVIYNPSTQSEVSNASYEKTVPSGAPLNLSGNFTDPATGQQANFIGTFNTLPGALATHQCFISFEVFSHSNVSWKNINWRPEVQLGDDPCGEPQQSIFPAVYYNTYNRLVKMNGPWTNVPSGTPTDKMRTWPEVDFRLYEQAFTSQELTDGKVIKDAWFVTKSGGRLLSKMMLRLKSDGTWGYYQIPVPGAGLFPLTYNNGPGVNSFNRSDVADGTLYTGFYSEDKMLADFLNNAFSSVRYYRVNGGVALEGSTTGFDIFAKHRTDLQDYHLHWGQFCWSNTGTPDAYIDIAELQMDRTTAVNNDYSNGSTPTTAEMEAVINENSETPIDQKFGMLIAKRGENQSNIPDYIYTDYAAGSEIKLDRWSAWGTYNAVYANSGAIGPGKFGEPEYIPAPTPVTGTYSAEAISLKFRTKTLAKSQVASTPDAEAAAGASSTINDPSKYNTQSLTSFMDVNGDSYPDILKGEGDAAIQLTSPTGGFRTEQPFSSFDGDATLEISVADDNGMTIAGNHINEDPRFQETSGASGTANMGKQETSYEWVDINGDGLPDRLNETAYEVELGTGNGLLPPASMTTLPTTFSENFALSLSASLAIMEHLKQGGGKGFSAGIGLNNVEGHTQKTLMDLNGDGLADILSVSGNDVKVYFNLGTTWETSAITLTGRDIDHSEANGIFGHVAGTYALGLPFLPALHLKLAMSGNAQGNFAVNKLKKAFRDMNGDGVLDYVSVNAQGDIQVSCGLAGKSNLLKTVVNPLDGSFTIDYERVGSKYGYYPVEVKLPTTKPGESMVWDMPYSKWVMSELAVFDGLDLTGSSSNDLDGSDTLKQTFAYDGGIKSRRERDFIGFTRVQTISEANIPPLTGCCGVRKFTSEVTEYARPLSNAPQHRRRFEYLKGLPMYQYSLYHQQQYVDVVGGGSVLEEMVFLKGQTKYKYEPRNIIQSGSETGLVEYDGEYPVLVNWDNVGETQSIFPALTEKQEVAIPDCMGQPDKFQAQQYEIRYDKYMNVIRYSRKGSDVPSGVTTTITGTTNDVHYEYHTEEFQYSMLHGGVYPFDSPTIDPVTGDYCYTLTLSGYEPANFCVAAYDLADPNDCFGPGSGEETFQIQFRKQVLTKTDIVEKTFNTTYKAPIIVTMNYFAPTASANRTNALQHQKIFIGSSAPTDFERGTTVVLDATKKAPAQIRNLLTYDGTDYAATDISYNTKGNIIQVTGPDNHKGENLSHTFTYDTETQSFITGVANSYDDAACFRYDQRTGNLLKKVDINGHATALTYDNFFRLKEVYGPREYENAASAPTISFEYYPEGINSASSDWRDTVPVAITKHNMAVSANLNGSAPAASCGTEDDFSSRPEMTTVMQTATFADGLQRVVQVKKEASKESSGANVVSHEVSGITSYDYLGRPASTSLSVSEAASAALGRLNNSKSAVLVASNTYDFAYPERVLQSSTMGAAGSLVPTNYNYAWSGNLWEIVTSTAYFSQKNYIDSEGNTVKTVQNSGGSQPDMITLYQYDQLGQLLSTSDPKELVTSYSYDYLGRLTQESHPDRGITTNTYDKAGNLIKTVTPFTGPTGIIYTYDYTRLESRTVPANPALYNVEYTWGAAGDGKNGAGRITQVVQGTTFLTERYAYDELGNRISEYKEIWVPNAGKRTYQTSFKYDSWGRMRLINYPDGEQVEYAYEPAGELKSIQSVSAGSQVIVDQLLYDGFGNIGTQIYGNGTKTNFTYHTSSRALTDVDLFASGSPAPQLLNKSYEYDDLSNVEEVHNTAGAYTPPSGFGNPLGGDYDYTFQYDNAGRFTGVDATDFKGGTYDLTMQYDLAGSIILKEQSFNPDVTHSYTLNYNYQADKPHQVHTINYNDHTGGGQYEYTYNGAGAITEIKKDNSTDQLYEWNEVGQLMGASNDQGVVHHFVYDHTGERILKGTLRNASGSNNGVGGGGLYIMDAYTLYVNPYYVVNNYSVNEEGNKHYYMGSQRIASAQVSYRIDLEPPLSYLPGDEGTPGSINNLHDVVTAIGERRAIQFDLDYPSLLQPQDYTTVFPFEDYDMALAEQGCETIECRCATNMFWTEEMGYTCLTTKVMYWYHPDYLGSVEFVTKMDGKPYQFFWYSPSGEPLVQQHYGAGLFSSRYFFNARELDSETGHYYHRFRYRDPQTVPGFTSPDPLHYLTPHISPYAYANNNPVNLIDPNGLSADPPEKAFEGQFKDGHVWKDQDGEWVLDLENREWVSTSTEVELGEVTVDGGKMSDLARAIIKNRGNQNQHFISAASTNWRQNWANSDNWFANFSYNLTNDAFVTLQAFDFDLLAREGDVNPFTGSSFYNLDGSTNYTQMDGFVNTTATVVPYARGAKVFEVAMPRGLGHMNKLNAAQFSRTFRGNLSGLPAAYRGAANRAINWGIGQWNSNVPTGMLLFNIQKP